MGLTVAQLLPDLNVGGVERGTVEIAQALVTAGHRAIVISSHGRLVDQLHACGAEHIALPIGRKSPTTLKYINTLRNVFIEQSVHIVHARSRLPAWIGWFALKRIASARRPRWVTTVHGPYTVNRYSRIMVSGERVIAISDFIRDYVLRNYPEVDRDRVTVVHRGVDREVFYPEFSPSDAWRSEWARTLNVDADTKLLLFPGRLTRWKGQLAFIELMARLVKKNRRVHGLIAGAQSDPRSSFEADLRTAIKQRGLDEHVTLLGARNDMRELFAIATLSFSLTSEPEAFGRTTLEALSLGTPVIGYAHGGTGEILQTVFPEGTVATGDVAAAADKAEHFLDNPPAVKPDHPLTLENMQARTLGVYEQLV